METQPSALPQDEASLDAAMYAWLLKHPLGRRLRVKLRTWTSAEAVGQVMGLEALAARDAMRAISDTFDLEAQRAAPDEWLDMKRDEFTARRLAAAAALAAALEEKKET